MSRSEFSWKEEGIFLGEVSWICSPDRLAGEIIYMLSSLNLWMNLLVA